MFRVMLKGSQNANNNLNLSLFIKPAIFAFPEVSPVNPDFFLIYLQFCHDEIKKMRINISFKVLQV